MCAKKRQQSTLNDKEGMSERVEKGQTAKVTALETWSEWFIWEDLEKLEYFFKSGVTQNGTVEILIWQWY